MPRLTGRDEVSRRKQRLDAIFAQLSATNLPPELIAHYARYLAVLVSGHMEQSVKELVQEYARDHADPRVQRHIGLQIRFLQNVKQEKLKQLVESFDPVWWDEISIRRVDELPALDSVTTIRNSISHGEDTGITLSRVTEYFKQISLIISDLCDRFDPP
ncbi:hypothetical protein VIMS_03596 [Mycobacterium marinum]|uniref:HEPN domain-containing protein n=1 Tax=Mycobacterium marinum TaxID=1781 RepID=UPI000E3CE6CB|nr:HEPN domain-containing protein [Mycobacterium marinum]RFZ10240.1 hypothetical protein VIMS_03596 [Mycobacterium marinum]